MNIQAKQKPKDDNIHTADLDLGPQGRQGLQLILLVANYLTLSGSLATDIGSLADNYYINE